MQNTASKRVLILGGGFAGLTVAMELDKKLARNHYVEITLIKHNQRREKFNCTVATEAEQRRAMGCPSCSNRNCGLHAHPDER